MTGTPILTPDGERPVEDIRPSDPVITQDRGVPPVIWAGHRRLGLTDLDMRPDWRPIHFAPWSVGNSRVVCLSPQHAVVVRLPDGSRALVRARHLSEAGLRGVRVARSARTVTYHHLLLPRLRLSRARRALAGQHLPVAGRHAGSACPPGRLPAPARDLTAPLAATGRPT